MRPSDNLNYEQLLAYRASWPWRSMMGSRACLKWSFRDLRNLDQTLKFVPGRRVAVQAGGNLGLFPKRLAEEFDQVVTFEPDPRLFARLLKNAPEKNIVPVQAALGHAHDPVAVLRARRDDSGRPVHEGLTHIAGTGDIPQIRLDDMGLSACDLLYLDIEGYELNALKGSEATILRCRPVITVEINRSITYYGATGDELRKWLEDRGYHRVLVVNSDETFSPSEI